MQKPQNEVQVKFPYYLVRGNGIIYMVKKVKKISMNKEVIIYIRTQLIEYCNNEN